MASIAPSSVETNTDHHSSRCSPKCSAITAIAIAVLVVGAALAVTGLIVFSGGLLVAGAVVMVCGACLWAISCCTRGRVVYSSSNSYSASYGLGVGSSCHNTGAVFFPQRSQHGGNPAPSTTEVRGQANPLRPPASQPARMASNDRGNQHGGAVVVETRR